MRVQIGKAEGGWNTVGGKTYYFRSRFEVRWARYLQLLKKGDKKMIEWTYEPRKFWFHEVKAGITSYKPDFYIIEKDDHYFVETKGHLTRRDITKFRRMAKYYPDIKLVLVMQAFTKKNALLCDSAKKYVDRVIDGGKILRKVGIK